MLTCWHELGVLIWYYWSPEDHPDFARNPPVWRTSIDHLEVTGLIRRVPANLCQTSVYEITDRGRVHVQALIVRPLPEQQWVAP